MRKTLSYHLESLFPNLRGEGYEVTSKKDKVYNCVAWAIAKDQKQWWEPLNEPGNYWPPGVPFDHAFDNYVKVFEQAKYVRCDTDALEENVEKVALYQSEDGWFTHVALQLPNGKWTSKLGPDEDIEHATLSGLESVEGGSVRVILKRPISQ